MDKLAFLNTMKSGVKALKAGIGKNTLGASAITGGVMGGGAGALIGGVKAKSQGNSALGGALKGGLGGAALGAGAMAGVATHSIGKVVQKPQFRHLIKGASEKTAFNVGQGLRSGASKLRSAGRRMMAPPAKRIGMVSALAGGTIAGGAGGAIHGAMTAAPGEDKLQAAKRGARTGAMVGAAGGMGFRHVGNKVNKFKHKRMMAAL